MESYRQISVLLYFSLSYDKTLSYHIILSPAALKFMQPSVKISMLDIDILTLGHKNLDVVLKIRQTFS